MGKTESRLQSEFQAVVWISKDRLQARGTSPVLAASQSGNGSVLATVFEASVDREGQGEVDHEGQGEAGHEERSLRAVHHWEGRKKSVRQKVVIESLQSVQGRKMPNTKCPSPLHHHPHPTPVPPKESHEQSKLNHYHQQ